MPRSGFCENQKLKNCQTHPIMSEYNLEVDRLMKQRYPFDCFCEDQLIPKDCYTYSYAETCISFLIRKLANQLSK
jgi:hypothetical protein